MVTSQATSVSAKLRKQVAATTAARLKWIQQTGEMKQARLGEMLGLSQSKVSELLRANTEVFSLDKLIDLAALAGLTVRVSVTRPYRQA